MRVVVQRVTEASVEVGGETVGRLDLSGGRPESPGGRQGLVALVGITHDDDEATAAALAAKLWQLRILDEPGGERAVSAADLGAPILVISQFTLYANTAKGRRPSWNEAAPGPIAEPLVDAFAQHLRDLGATVATGRFGAHMRVSLVNDGPVTLILDS